MSAPAMAAHAPPMKKVNEMTKLTLMPIRLAARVFCSVARIARPIFVRCTRKVSMTSSTIATISMMIWLD